MMRCASSRRGSALLIVLGMLAFMVVSAVAFSAYMRSSRLPSSYLRRVVASRMLAKAALAEAIDEIDAAIGNMPHPGVWLDDGGLSNGKNISYDVNRETDYVLRGHNSNAWLGRVYIGGTSGVTRVEERLIPQNKTVPTLTLEGLAYIPPPLVNEARYYSRHSNAGTWHTMGFDAGRYAFCAIDVSDYFDINALKADAARNSSPEGRISLASLFDDIDHQSPSPGDAANWDKFIDDYITAKVPLISMADWNLAFYYKHNDSGLHDIRSYFCRFAKGHGDSFYGGDAEGGNAQKIARMAFQTDGYFPQEDPTATGELDLSDEKNQPFPVSMLEQGNKGDGFNVEKQVVMHDQPAEVWNLLKQSIGGLGGCLLFDYLDKDSVPLSLAMPSVERNPMVCALNLRIENLKLELPPGTSSGDTYSDENEKTRTVTRVVTYRFKAQGMRDGLAQTAIRPMLVYPFAHKDPSARQYDVDGRLTFFFNDGGMKLRTSADDALHLGNDPDLKDVKVDMEKGVIAVPLPEKTVSFGDREIQSELEAINESVELRANTVAAKVASGLDEIELLKITYEWTQTKKESETGQTVWEPEDPESKDIKGDVVCNFNPLDAAGKVVSGVITKEKIMGGGEGGEYELQFAVWIRIRSKNANDNNKYVDLVPASAGDDVALNKNSNSGKFAANLGADYPLLRFNTGIKFKVSFDQQAIQGNTILSPSNPNGDVTPKCIMVADPRYNHAPESWFVVSGDDLTAAQWLDKCGRKGINGDRRDGDIFMQTSDQCYLQSIYELANLPRLGNFYLEGSSKQLMDGYKNPATLGITEYRTEGQIADTANVEFMWKTYNPFPRFYQNDRSERGVEVYEGDNFAQAGFVNSGAGFKINPYSDNTNVMMAAFANTPLEWRYASADDLANLGYSEKSDFNSKYAWNSYSSGGKLMWRDLEGVARAFMGSMRHYRDLDQAWPRIATDASGNFEAPPCSLGTGGNGEGWYVDGDNAPENALCGIELDGSGSPLWNTDKKFLYGFWRECFAVKQQLFLIFVRAEPMLMGGGAVGQTPPQLGARAVALVWRDPIDRSNNGEGGGKNENGGCLPHRTRILFYRQFD